ncbi:mitochondrial carrier domain-containing protein [Phycomyces nitens]|nr:mitochondrial carrier domain-containing protein [Phycomyces nitens]
MEPMRNGLKHLIQDNDAVVHSISGAAAGGAAAMVTCPLDVVKTRLQNQGPQVNGAPQYKGTLGTLSRIWCEEGIRGWYRGLGPTVIGYLPTWAIYFTAYDAFKAFGTDRVDSGWMVHMVSAMSAGAVTSLVTNPLWVIKTRFMTQNHQTPYRYKNTIDAVFTIARKEGIWGFYKGLGSSLFGVSHVAVQFPLYENLKQVLRNNGRGDHFPSIILASSLSKMAACLATYPHEVIRTRLQNQTTKPFKYKGIGHTIQVIAAEEGIGGFYKGLSTNLIRTVPSAAITLLTYEYLKKRLHDLGEH